MKAEDVTATLDLALQASGLDQAKPANRTQSAVRQRVSYVAGDLAKWLHDRKINTCAAPPIIR